MADCETFVGDDAKHKVKSKRKVGVELPTLCTFTRQKMNYETGNPYAQLLCSNASSFNKGHIVQKDNRKLTNKSEFETENIKSRNSQFTAKGGGSQYFKFEHLPGHTIQESSWKDNIIPKRHSVFNNSFYQELLEKYQILNNKHPKKNGVHKLHQGLFKTSNDVHLRQEQHLHTAQNLGTEFLSKDKSGNLDLKERQIKSEKKGSNAVQAQLQIENVTPDNLVSEPQPKIVNSNNEMVFPKKKVLVIENEQQPLNNKAKLKRNTLKLFESKILSNLATNEAREREKEQEKKEQPDPKVVGSDKKLFASGLSPKNFPAKSFSNLLKKMKKKKETSVKELELPTMLVASGAKSTNYNVVVSNGDERPKLDMNQIEKSYSPEISSKSVFNQSMKPRRFKIFCCF